MDKALFICIHTEAQYQFRDICNYATEEGVNASITVIVEQVHGSLTKDIHLLLIPMTYAQYTQRASQPGSNLRPINEFHGNRPADPAECK